MPPLSFSAPNSVLGLSTGLTRSPGKLTQLLVRNFSTRRPLDPRAPWTFCDGASTSQRVGLRLSPVINDLRLRLPPRSQPTLLARTQIRTAVFPFRPIIHYSQLPRDYKDEDGLEVSKEDLGPEEISRIFHPALDVQTANKLLKIIHGRRVAGTLEDPDLQHNTARYNSRAKIQALEYLREAIPVDEIINAGLNAEDELKALEQLEQQQPPEQSDQDPASTRPEKSTPTKGSKSDSTKAPETGSWRDVYGESNFDRLRRQNIAKQEARERQEEEERKHREEQEALQNIGTLQTQQAKPRELSPRMKKYTERATSNLTEAPEMTKWERLAPSLAFTLIVLACCAVFAASYTPPRQSWRVWPDIPPAAATVATIAALNMIVFMAWKTPMAWGVLNRYFIVLAATPRPFQLLGATFSHHGAAHLTANMLTLWFFGTRLHDEIGRGNFLALYVASGTVGFMTSLASLVLWRGLQFTTLGASAPVYGLMAAFFWMHRFDEFKILGYPPDPMQGPQGLAFLGLILGLHLVGFFTKRGRGIDLWSHLGGMLAGGVSMELVKKRAETKARLRAERLKSMRAVDTVVEKKPRGGDER